MQQAKGELQNPKGLIMTKIIKEYANANNGGRERVTRDGEEFFVESCIGNIGWMGKMKVTREQAKACMDYTGAPASVVVAILGEEVEVAADNSNMTEAQARAIVGNDAVEKVLSENCEPTGRVGFNGSCQGDELIEWSASIAAIDADGRDCRLEARYYTSRDQEQSVIDGGGWSDIDWAVDHLRVC